MICRIAPRLARADEMAMIYAVARGQERRTMMDKDTKKAIDQRGYRDMLEKVRFAEPGSLWFVGETGEYFMAVMRRKREELGNAAHVASSKSIGWER